MRLPKKKLKPILPIKGSRSFPKHRPPPLPDAPGSAGISITTDTEFNEIFKLLGGRQRDMSLARRVQKMQAQYPRATLPELVTMDWLNANSIPHIYQAQLFGGRGQRGGLVPDFVLFQGGYSIAWLVQGEWHHSPGGQRVRNQTNRDYYARLKLKGTPINGVRIEMVVELWENDIYQKRPEIFIHAMNGISIRFGF